MRILTYWCRIDTNAQLVKLAGNDTIVTQII